MPHIKCSAPSRVDLSGGAADMFGKCTLCSAISLRTYCEVACAKRGAIIMEGAPVALHQVPVLASTLARITTSFNAELSIHSEVPVSAGLGGSASMSVAVLYALSLFTSNAMSLYEIAEQAQRAETDLGMLNGYQDWYAASFGGLLFLDFRGKSNKPIDQEPYATVEPLSHYKGNIRFVVADTGVSHSSAASNDELYRRYKAGDKKIVALIERLDWITREGKRAIIERDIEQLGDVIKENQDIMREVGRSIPENEQLIKAAYRGGAVACKVTGAGQGGCIAALCSGDRNQKSVEDRLLEETSNVFPVQIDDGVRTEESYDI
ncbi:MAG: hypothetical protein HXS41_08230 [Theionarchaea archaeon]|nr:hypothetical protein [Theionarchaea archaeon]MBU7021033.1 hypothetical protein [Theionarchaea archaeon]